MKQIVSQTAIGLVAVALFTAAAFAQARLTGDAAVLAENITALQGAAPPLQVTTSSFTPSPRDTTPGTLDAASGGMTGMELLTWIIVGLVAGVLASLVVGGVGLGLIGDIVIGVVGAFVGGYLFHRAGWTAPFGGLAGVIFIAFIGAVVLLVILHLIRGVRGAPV